MKCENIKLKISEYIDSMLTDEESKLFQEHLLECEECSVYYENFKMMIESLNEIDLVDPPINFNEQLQKRLVKEKSLTRKVLAYKKPILAVAALFLVAVISLPMIGNVNLGKGFGMKSAQDMASEENRNFEVADAPQYDGDSLKRSPSITTVEFGSASASVTDVKQVINQNEVERKIIKRGRMSLEVDVFDKVYDSIVEKVESNNGYIQSSEIFYHFLNKERPEESLKSAHMEIRIPSHMFTEIFENIKGFGVAVEEAVTGEDITERYSDIENEVYNLRIQEVRLREILQKAELIEDILRIENELSRVRYQINSLDSSLNQYDKLVSLSTINIQLRQVRPDQVQIQSVSTGIWSKAKNNFIDSVNKIIALLEGLFVGTFLLLPIAIFIVIIAVPAWIFIKKKKNELKH